MKDPKSSSPVSRFIRMLEPDRKEISQIYLYALFNGMVNLSLPLGIQAIINLIQGGRISTSWIVLVGVVILGIAFAGLLQIMQLRITENIQQRIFTRASFDFAYRVPRIRLEALYNLYAPELMNRFFDILTIQKGLPKILMDLSTASLQIVFGLILLSLYHPFFIVFGLILVLLLYLIFRFTGKQGLKSSYDESTYKYRVAHWLEELARTKDTFKLAGKTLLPLQKADREVSGYLDAREKHFGLLLRQYVGMVGFKIIVAAGLLIMGGKLVLDQQMNIGQFVAAEIIILLIMNSTEKLILSFETIYDVLTGVEKMSYVTQLELERVEGEDAEVLRAGKSGLTVEVRDLIFTYPGSLRSVLENMSFVIRSGEKVCICGPNGSGKSTLMQVIGGLYQATAGQLLFNGIPASAVKIDALRSMIGDSLTREQVFEGTLWENIAMGRPGVTRENVELGIDAFQLRRWLQQQPMGLHQAIYPGGARLPRSIIQKILLVRSIADTPQLLLLEDALEHIEQGERNKIIDFITSPERPWTLVAISSNPEFMRRCNRLIWIEDGRVARIGKYDDLIDDIKRQKP